MLTAGQFSGFVGQKEQTDRAGMERPDGRDRKVQRAVPAFQRHAPGTWDPAGPRILRVGRRRPTRILRSRVIIIRSKSPINNSIWTSLYYSQRD